MVLNSVREVARSTKVQGTATTTTTTTTSSVDCNYRSTTSLKKQLGHHEEESLLQILPPPPQPPQTAAAVDHKRKTLEQESSTTVTTVSILSSWEGGSSLCLYDDVDDDDQEEEEEDEEEAERHHHDLQRLPLQRLTSVERQAAFLRQESLSHSSSHNSDYHYQQQQSSSTIVCGEEEEKEILDVYSATLTSRRKDDSAKLVDQHRFGRMLRSQSLPNGLTGSSALGSFRDDDEEEEEEDFFRPSFALEDEFLPMDPLPMLFPYHVSSGIGLAVHHHSSIFSMTSSTGSVGRLSSLSHSFKLGAASMNGAGSTTLSSVVEGPVTMNATSTTASASAAPQRQQSMMSPSSGCCFQSNTSLRRLPPRRSRSCDNLHFGKLGVTNHHW